MGFSFAYVRRIETLNPRLRRIHFDVPELAALELPSHPDDAVGIYVPGPTHSCPPAMTERDGIWGYYDPESAPQGRNYSVRQVDHTSSTMVVDFVVHANGPATGWAQRAVVGDGVGMSHGRGWFRPGPSADWLLLVADLAGLPAAARILEEVAPTPDRPITLIVEVAHEDDLTYLTSLDHHESSPHCTVIPLIGSGNGSGPSELGAAVTAIDLPTTSGYCWFAGEAAESRTVRNYLRREHHWRPDQYDILGYWRLDGEEWSRRFAEHGDELFAVYQRAIADGKSEKRASEEFDEALERAGL